MTPAETLAVVEGGSRLVRTMQSPFGRLRHGAPVGRMSATPGRWTRPPAKLGSHEPAWV